MDLASFPPGIQQHWEDFARDVHPHLPSGATVYPQIFSHGSLFPLQRKNETDAMVRLAQSIKPRVVMEIGADKGGGFYHLVQGLRDTIELAIASEFRGCPFYSAFHFMFPEKDFLFLEGSSFALQTVEAVRTKLGAKRIDLLFIDGSKAHTLQDFLAYLPLMRSGGLVFIHDIVDDINPGRVFWDLRKQFRIGVIVDGREGAEAEQRAREGKPVDSGHEDWLRIWKWNSCGVGVVYV